MANKKGLFGGLKALIGITEPEPVVPPQPAKKNNSGQRNNNSNNKSNNGNQNRNNNKKNNSKPQNSKQNSGNQKKESTQNAQSGEIQLGNRKRSGNNPRQSNQNSNQKAAKPVITTDESGISTLEGSTRIAAKEQRNASNRAQNSKVRLIAEAEFLANREKVDRKMLVRKVGDDEQIAVLEDDILVEHYISKQEDASVVGNIYLGRVENVLPSMEAAFIDIGTGRNAILYSEALDWAEYDMQNAPQKIENALKVGDSIMVQATKDPVGKKGARLITAIMLTGRYFVLSPTTQVFGISHKIAGEERARITEVISAIDRKNYGLIVRTAAVGIAENDLKSDLESLLTKWENIQNKIKDSTAPATLQDEADMPIRVIRDIFNDSFNKLIIQGEQLHNRLFNYIKDINSELTPRIENWTGAEDLFESYSILPQLSKGLDRKVWLPSGGTLIIDRTEAMTVIDVNTGKFTGSGGSLEETVTSNNLEAAEEIVRQLRLRDIGGIIIVDFIDMILEANRDLVLRRLIECFARDRTKHHVAEVTSLGLIQITRKRVGQGLIEAFSEECRACKGKGYITHLDELETGLKTPAPSILIDLPPAPESIVKELKKNQKTESSKKTDESAPSKPKPAKPAAKPAAKKAAPKDIAKSIAKASLKPRE